VEWKDLMPLIWKVCFGLFYFRKKRKGEDVDGPGEKEKKKKEESVEDKALEVSDLVK
jgi:hypothetical protein